MLEVYRMSVDADDDGNDSLETYDGAAALLEVDGIVGGADEDDDTCALETVEEEVLVRDKYENDDEDSLVAVAGIVVYDDEEDCFFFGGFAGVISPPTVNTHPPSKFDHSLWTV